MGSSGKGKKAPPPPKIEAPVSIVEEADLMATQQEYMDQKADERMSVQNTLMTSQVEPRQTIMTSGSKKKKKKLEDMNTPSMGMY